MNDQVAIIPETAIQVAPQSPMDMAQSFLASGGDLKNLEKMMDLQERFEKNEAKKAFVKAMAAFKANPPKIMKDRTVDFTTPKGRTVYNHASIGNVVEKISAALGEHGLAATWKPDQSSDGVKVTCTVTHELGHSESASLTANADNSGNKNTIQAIGSTITYLERYTLLSLTGLATHDQDDDGNGAGTPIECLTTDQVIDINDRLKETKSDIKKFLLNFQSESVEQIPKNQYGRALNMLKSKAGEL